MTQSPPNLLINKNPTSKWDTWAPIINQQKNSDSYKSIFGYTDWRAIPTSSVMSAFVGGVVVSLVLCVTRTSFVLSDNGCLFDTPQISFIKLSFVCLFVSVALIVLDAKT